MNVQELIKSILQNVQDGKIDTSIAFQIVKNLQEIQKHKEMPIQQNDIAVIGIACKFPEANNKQEYWSNIKQKKCSIHSISQNRKADLLEFFRLNGLDKEPSILDAGYLSEIDMFDAGFFKISPMEAALINPVQRLFLETSYEAFEDAGYGGNLIYHTKTGVFVGVDHSIEFDYAKLYGKCDILSMLGSYSSLLANRISYYYNFRGPAIVVDTACSSGLVAVHQACQALRNQECEMAIAGGVNVLFYREKTALSGVESETSVVKAFDKDANGTVWGEGVGAVLLKPVTKAIEDGDHIYVVLKGSAVNSDGFSNGITAPNAEAQKELLIQAWAKAGIDPTTIDYIETHGTGTVLGDPIEIKGINDAFRKFTNKRQFCAINSVKNNIGHTCGASGIASLIKAVLAIVHKQIPANINFDRPNPFVNFLDSAVYMNDQFKPWITDGYPRRAGVNAFGLSGTNCHIVVEEAPAVERYVISNEMYVLALSAQHEEGIKELIKGYYDLINNQPDLDVRSLCITANTGRGHYNYRFIVRFINADDLTCKLKKVIKEKCLDTLMIKDVYYKHQIISDNRDKNHERNYTEKDIFEISNDINNKIKYIEESGQSYTSLLEQICLAYIKGADVNWLALYQGQTYQKLSLPSHPFNKIRCWASDVSQMNVRDNVQSDKIDTFYQVSWVPKKLKQETYIDKQGIVLVFQNKADESAGFIQAMKEQGVSLIIVTQGDRYKKINDTTYVAVPDEDSYITLFSDIRDERLTQILFLHDLSYEEPETIKQLRDDQKYGVMSLYYLTRALCSCRIDYDLDLVLISSYVNEVTGEEERINPQSAALFGLGRVIEQEYPSLRCRAIDIDIYTDEKDIIQEMKYGGGFYQVAYRGGQRLAEELHEQNLDIIEDKNISIRQDGVYVITGGMGGIGLEFAKYLAGKGCVKLALLNRSQFPDRNDWDEIITKQEDAKVIKKIADIYEIEAMGSGVSFYSLDVTNYDEVNKVLQELRDLNGSINGIIHCAGISKDGLIKDKKDDIFKSILGVKMEGTWILDKLTQQDNLDFFILCSSVASLLGGAGKGDYTAGNAYLDAFAAYRCKKGKNTLSIDWPVWKDTGMAVDHLANQDGIFKMIETKKAMECVEKIWNKNINRIIIGTINNMQYQIPYIPVANLRSIKIVYLNTLSQQKKVKGVVLKGREDHAYTKLEIKAGDVWRDILGLDVICIDDDFFKIGGNSILAIQMEVGMENNGIEMLADDLKKHETIRKLAAYLDMKDKKGSNQVVIEPMVPFNEVFYKECFYNSLFPIVKHFKGNIGYFFANDIIRYHYNDSTQEIIKFEVDYVSVQNEKHVFDACGVSYNFKEKADNVIEEVKTSISNGKPVIIWIDCFYDSIRVDTYKKEHLPHTLLLYGYDERKKVFHIIEHNNRDNLSYVNCTISYEDVCDCYEGYLARFKGNHRDKTYYEFYAGNHRDEDNDEDNTIMEVIKENFLSHKDVLLDNVKTVKKITGDIGMLLSDENMLKKNIALLVKRLNDIMNAKQVQKYSLMNYFKSSNQLLVQLDDILDSWEKVRAWFVKYMFTSVYTDKSVKNILNYLENISDAENKFVLQLMNQVQNSER